MPKVTVDGKTFEANKGDTLLEAIKTQGVEVPYYCYHPGLSLSGNCRICLVEVEGPRGNALTTSCNFILGDQDVVCNTTNDAALKGREAVMEFLQVNHPLDCPVCDKAGECKLQDFSFDHGRAKSRMVEAKVIKPKKSLGKDIKLWPQRCISCRRCTRFLDEISGTSELEFRERGDHMELDCFPGKEIDNPLSRNIVDICPVGALIDVDFNYSVRPWYLQSKASTCTGCSKGCANFIDTQPEHPNMPHEAAVVRMRTREDLDVNGHWICDEGRASVHRQRDQALGHSLVNQKACTEDEAQEAIVEWLKQKGSSVHFVASAHAMNEDLEALKELAAHFGQSVQVVLQHEVQEDQVFPGFTIPGDKNPNRKGCQDILGLGNDAFGWDAWRKNIPAGAEVFAIGLCDQLEIPAGAVDQVKLGALLTAFNESLTPAAERVLRVASNTQRNASFSNAQGQTRQVSKAKGLGAVPRSAAWRIKQIHKAVSEVKV